MVDVVAGLLLIAGGGVAAAAVVRRPGSRLASAALAAALVVAGVAAFLDDPAARDLTIAACGLAVAGLAFLVLERSDGVSSLSWLDAAMTGSAAGALAASLSAPAALALGAAGAVGALALSRWRPGSALLLGVAGLLALAAGAPLAPVAALGVAGAAWLREAPAGPGPAFSPVVLSAILVSATSALTLLTFGQFTDVSDVAVALATV